MAVMRRERRPRRRRCRRRSNGLPRTIQRTRPRRTRPSLADAAYGFVPDPVRIPPELLGDELLEACAVPPILDVVLGSRPLEVLGGDLDPSFAQDLVSIPQH